MTTTATGGSTQLSWDDVTALVSELGDGAFLATVQADGRPHVAWVAISYGEERLWFSTFRSSQKARNLRHAPAVALTWPERPDRLVFARADARLVDDRAESDRLWDEGVLSYDPAMFFSGKGRPRAAVRRAPPDPVRVPQPPRPHRPAPHVGAHEPPVDANDRSGLRIAG